MRMLFLASTQGQRVAGRRTRIHNRALRLEQLEDRCLLASGLVEFAVNASPVNITKGPDGALWFTEVQNGTDFETSNQIGRLAVDGSVTQFAIPPLGATFNFGAAAVAGLHITTGPDGNLWYTEIGVSKIARLTPNGTVTEFATPTAEANPGFITAGPDGNIWFTELAANEIGRITPGGVITEFALPTANSRPTGITVGPDGNLWFTEAGSSQIGRITPTGAITEFPAPNNTANALNLSAITLGPDGNLWFTEAYVPQIGRITPQGAVTEFSVPGDAAGGSAITAGSDGNIWYTGAAGGKMVRITPTGTMTEYLFPTSNAYGTGITTGPDGNLWVGETVPNFSNGPNASKIGHFILSTPGTPEQRFVTQLYLDLLHRLPEAAGLATWVGLLDTGVPRQQAALDIATSQEYRIDEVEMAYNKLLKRDANPLGLEFSVSFLTAGGTLEQLESSIAGSPEYFQSRGASNFSDGWVQNLYTDVLGRSPDPSGRNTIDQALAAGISPAAIASTLFASSEYQQDEVTGIYQRILHRAVDAQGLQTWVNALRQGIPDEVVLADIVGSPEYFVQV